MIAKQANQEKILNNLNYLVDKYYATDVEGLKPEVKNIQIAWNQSESWECSEWKPDAKESISQPNQPNYHKFKHIDKFQFRENHIDFPKLCPGYNNRITFFLNIKSGVFQYKIMNLLREEHLLEIGKFSFSSNLFYHKGKKVEINRRGIFKILIYWIYLK